VIRSTLRTARGAALGLRAVLVTPAWIRSGRWRTLLEPPPSGRGALAGDVRTAARASRLGLRALALLPFSPWQRTCLYRSIAACLSLRACGVPAVLRIGAAPDAGLVRAHAWVEDEHGALISGTSAGWHPLTTGPQH